ncbi:hypothetical protein HPB49_014725 [Dermacentor silvarum]|uniref:Uncharacterized protein n=1 Tax=Dermacentor silvarum TaxID=543639 RepID=A0ACB8CLL1_DERSI|nr:uncharacterized protein LOC125946120 [Dermacentor silvarum]KAH7945726.1 hypothetical protein HPB49_014725 [Dermacentor silvarum]
MSSDVSLASDGESWPPTKSAPRQLTISWIQVITGIVQFYCVMCHCVILMLIAVWMVIKEVSRRSTLLWTSWYSGFKEKRPATLAFLAGAIHMTMMSKTVPEPPPSEDSEDAVGVVDAEDVSDEAEQCSEEQSEVLDVAESRPEECISSALTVSASTSGVCSSSSPPESRVADVTESESTASLDTRPQNQQLSKRAPCSISAVVEDKYACGLNRSTSSSAMSIEDLDDSSDDDGVDGFDERSKSSSQRPKSTTVSCTGSWKLKSAFQRASGKSNEIQSCFPKSKAPTSQAPCPEKSKFSLGPVISNLRRVCTRTLSAINKELTECMSPQSQKSRSRKTETPVRDTSQIPLSREVQQQPQSEDNRDASKDLSVPEQRTSLQSSWNDVCSSGTRTSSDSLGEMHRGLLDSFSEAESSDFPNRQSADHHFGDAAPEEKPTPFSADAIRAEGDFENGESDWTTQKSTSNAFFNSESAGTNAFGTVFQTDGHSPGWEFQT